MTGAPFVDLLLFGLLIGAVVWTAGVVVAALMWAVVWVVRR